MIMFVFCLMYCLNVFVIVGGVSFMCVGSTTARFVVVVYSVVNCLSCLFDVVWCEL